LEWCIVLASGIGLLGFWILISMTSAAHDFEGGVALVTGAGSGIGAAIAADFLRSGARVVGAGRHRPLPDLAADIKVAGNRWLWVHADVRREADVRQLVGTVLSQFGHVDILINNAAIRGPTDPATKLKRQDWDHVLETNLTGAFLCARECLRHMMRRRRGRIINISSIAGRMAYPLRAAYCASKWGLIGLTLTLAQEAGSSNVRVNAICPGPVEGPAMESVIVRRARALRISVEKMRQRYVKPTALGRMVSASDVSGAVLFLCSEAARSVTGQVIDVSAGFGLAPV
jgi:NAD(P)-dependent dehydrogenase (short-subunit alcohol dehydrogenase family)